MSRLRAVKKVNFLKIAFCLSIYFNITYCAVEQLKIILQILEIYQTYFFNIRLIL